MIDECVSLIEVDVMNKTYCIYGEDGSVNEVLCDTIDQFLNVLDLVRSNSDRTEVVYLSDGSD
jgi:hypothetical protein|tara:strand:+ start:1290 stop:1478 length:189 start_codon:yes stop_codon:yes gene_type:complete